MSAKSSSTTCMFVGLPSLLIYTEEQSGWRSSDQEQQVADTDLYNFDALFTRAAF
eukprot:m.13497 g.13497  ORF g.13497 m.13497 type:complete len:55 (+) comp6191_c1_seq1:1755-1919(+)